MTEPSALLCITCSVYGRTKPRRPNNPQVCDGDRERLVADLASIPPAYLSLSAALLPGRTGEAGRTNGFESRPPLVINALSLMSAGHDTPLARLETWMHDWAGHLSTKPIRIRREQRRGIAEVCGWLTIHLPSACNDHPAVDEFAADVRDIAGQLRPYSAGKDKGESVGHCPRKNGAERCNTPLYVDPYVDEIQCGRCRTTWKRRDGQWMHLAAQQQSSGVESAEVEAMTQDEAASRNAVSDRAAEALAYNIADVMEHGPRLSYNRKTAELAIDRDNGADPMTATYTGDFGTSPRKSRSRS